MSDFKGHTLNVKFYKRSWKNESLSILEQRPIFEDKTFVRIEIPGNDKSIIDTLAEDYHQASYPIEWARFKNSTDGEQGLVGTPLTEWSLLSPATAENLKHYKFMTIEQVAGASDAALMAIGMVAGMSGYELRDQAKYYLTKARDNASAVRQVAELDVMRQQHQISQEQIGALMAQVATLVSKPKRTRRPSVKKEAELSQSVEPIAGDLSQAE